LKETHSQIAKLLKESGVEPESDKQGALQLAVRENDIASVERLLAAGAEPNSGPHHPLSAAAGSGYEEIVDALLKAGADVNRKEGEGYFTPLIRAASNGHLNLVKRLVAAGADLSASISGNNASDHAKMDGHDHLARWLDENGSPTQRDVAATCRELETAEEQSLNWDHFRKHAEVGNGEYSLIFAKAPIAEVSSAIAAEIESAKRYAHIELQAAAIPRSAHPIFVIQLADQSWTIVVHGMGSLSRRVFDDGRRLAEACAKTKGWEVIYAWANDTDYESWFCVLDDGEDATTNESAVLGEKGILIPGLNPFGPDGLELIGVSRETLRQVDVIAAQ
jgi:hypothetical protein